MSIEELTDWITMQLTGNCMLPSILNNDNIRLQIKVAKNWMYENYKYALIQSYLFVPHATLTSEFYTRYKYITLPESVQNVVKVFPLTNRSVFELGWGGAPNLSIGVGVTTNQQYLSSSLTTIGELGVYKVVIDGFAQQLNQLSKRTVEYDFNFGSKQFHVLTNVPGDLVLKIYERIDEDALFEEDKMKRYVLALCKQALGNYLTLYTIPLPGGVQINGEAMKSQGEAELQAIRDEIKGQSQVGFFYMF